MSDARTTETQFSRKWAMPSTDTFKVQPIGQFVLRYLAYSKFSVDPFARDNVWAKFTNDINPNTKARWHMDAETFLDFLASDACEVPMEGKIDLAILDPPYSPRQISESYRAAGLNPGQTDTQNAALMARVRAALLPLLMPDAIVLSFGWNSSGMGKGFRQLEIMLVAHGGAHNDTICMAERRIA